MPETKTDIIQRLRKEILLLQGFRSSSASTVDMGLGPITAAFPNAVFPTGAIHEFLCAGAECAAAAGGFVAALTAPLMGSGGAFVWISSARKIFPPGLKAFGIEPDRVVFVDLKNEKEVLWAMEEALTCEGLAAVIGETPEIGFTASRRLQLAVERSGVTGLVLRHNPRNLNAIACIARWVISPLPSDGEVNMPGIGFPRWRVELARIRGGKPGIWELEWSAGRFRPLVPETPALSLEQRRKTG